MARRKQDPAVEPLTENEISEQEGEHLPAREVMSTVRWPLMPEDPEPYAPLLDHKGIEPPPPTDA